MTHTRNLVGGQRVTFTDGHGAIHTGQFWSSAPRGRMWIVTDDRKAHAVRGASVHLAFEPQGALPNTNQAPTQGSDQ